MGRNNSDFQGGRWGTGVSMIPVEQLAKYREFDRKANGFPGYSDKKISGIADELRAGGVDALREPLVMNYNHQVGWAHLSEGNHRLAAAIEAGVEHLPVKFESAGADIVSGARRMGRGNVYPLK